MPSAEVNGPSRGYDDVADRLAVITVPVHAAHLTPSRPADLDTRPAESSPR